MAGVDAQADARTLEDPLGLRAALDHGAHVRVQRGLDPAARGVVGDPVEVGEQGLPAALVELGTGVVPVPAGPGREHHHAGLGGQALVDERVDARDAGRGRGRAGPRRGSRRRPRGRTRKLRDAGLGVGLEEAGRTELGGHEPEAPHLGEHPLRRQLVPPAGHLAEAPGDGRPGDAVNGKGSGHDTDPIEGVRTDCQYFVLTLDHLTYSRPCPPPSGPSTTCSRRSPSTGRSPIPLWFQVAQHFEQSIAAGTLPQGTLLDNEIVLGRAARHLPADDATGHGAARGPGAHRPPARHRHPRRAAQGTPAPRADQPPRRPCEHRPGADHHGAPLRDGGSRRGGRRAAPARGGRPRRPGRAAAQRRGSSPSRG